MTLAAAEFETLYFTNMMNGKAIVQTANKFGQGNTSTARSRANLTSVVMSLVGLGLQGRFLPWKTGLEPSQAWGLRSPSNQDERLLRPYGNRKKINSYPNEFENYLNMHSRCLLIFVVLQTGPRLEHLFILIYFVLYKINDKIEKRPSTLQLLVNFLIHTFTISSQGNQQ